MCLIFAELVEAQCVAGHKHAVAVGGVAKFDVDKRG